MRTSAVIEAELERLAACRCELIELAGLISRSSIVYKWKACVRTWILRELFYWRFHDLLVQVQVLANESHALGARIMLRSALETVAMLVYLNYKMQQVLDGTITFQDYGNTTVRMLLGSKDKSTSKEAVNILTVLEKCGSKHSGLVELHELLCEVAHPNFDGLHGGYADLDTDNHVTRFTNTWGDRWGPEQYEAVEQCIKTFEHEYNDIWPTMIVALESWVEQNDTRLEAEQNGI